MAERTLIRGGCVVTLEPSLGDFACADVLIEGSRIRAVAPRIEAEDCAVIDARGRIVSPGFVDTHRHVWQTQLRGVAADWSLFDYFRRMRSAYACLYGPEDVHLGNLVGALEALDAGITTLVDHCHVLNSPEHADAAVGALLESGIRGVFAYGLFSNPLQHPLRPEPDPGWRRADARRVRARYFASDGGRLVMGLAPSEIEALPLEATCDEIRFAREIGAHRISCHVAMGAYDAGRRLVAQLAREGLLADDLLFVHGSALGDDELDQLADCGAGLSSTPETELQMAMGHPVAARALARGVATSLGVDIVSNVSGDLFAQMRLWLQSERGHRNAARTAPPRHIDPPVRQALELATRGGARVAGLRGATGTLAPGCPADVIVTRTDGLHLAGAVDPVAALVLYARPSDVECVIVDGRLRKRDGRLVGVDWPELRARLVASSERILAADRGLDHETIDAPAARLMLRES